MYSAMVAVPMFGVVVSPTFTAAVVLEKIAGTLLTAATSEDLNISFLDLTIVRLIFFEAQCQAARFTTSILTSRQSSQPRCNETLKTCKP